MRLVIVLAILHCLAFIDRTMIGGALPLIRSSVPMTDAQAGWIIGTAFAATYGVAASILAVFRRSHSPSSGWLGVGVIIWTVGSVCTGLATSLGTLTAARAMMGIGQGVFVPLAIAYLVDGASAENQSKSLGIFVSGASLGRSTALLAVGSLLVLLEPLASQSDVAVWRWLFVLTGIPNVIAAAVLLSKRSSAPVPARAKPHPRLRWRELLPVFLVAFAPVMFAQAILNWLPTLLVRERGLSTVDAALMIGSVTLFAAPAGPMIAGWLFARSHRWQERMPLLVLIALAAALLFLAAVVRAPTLIGAIAGMAAMLVSLGIALLGGLFGIQLRTPRGESVRVNGTYLACTTFFAVGSGPLLTGAFAMHVGRAGTAFGDALLVTGAAVITACALAAVVACTTAQRTP